MDENIFLPHTRARPTSDDFMDAVQSGGGGVGIIKAPNRIEINNPRIALAPDKRRYCRSKHGKPNDAIHVMDHGKIHKMKHGGMEGFYECDQAGQPLHSEMASTLTALHSDELKVIGKSAVDQSLEKLRQLELLDDKTFAEVAAAMGSNLRDDPVIKQKATLATELDIPYQDLDVILNLYHSLMKTLAQGAITTGADIQNAKGFTGFPILHGKLVRPTVGAIADASRSLTSNLTNPIKKDALESIAEHEYNMWDNDNDRATELMFFQDLRPVYIPNRQISPDKIGKEATDELVG